MIGESARYGTRRESLTQIVNRLLSHLRGESADFDMDSAMCAGCGAIIGRSWDLAWTRERERSGISPDELERIIRERCPLPATRGRMGPPSDILSAIVERYGIAEDSLTRKGA